MKFLVKKYASLSYKFSHSCMNLKRDKGSRAIRRDLLYVIVQFFSKKKKKMIHVLKARIIVT